MRTKRLGLALAEDRVAADLKQEVVAALLSPPVVPSMISEWERGLKNVPAGRLLEFARLYRKPISRYLRAVHEDDPAMLAKMLPKLLDDEKLAEVTLRILDGLGESDPPPAGSEGP